MAENAASSRIGTAVEYLVAASAILASEAELNVSTSIVDDEGVDLVFHRRGGSATLAVQVKARTTDTSQHRRGNISANVRVATFRARDDLAVLVVLVDKRSASIVMAWLIPSADFEEQAMSARGGEVLKFAASVKPNTGDKWSQYRLTPAELADRLVAWLREADGKAQVNPAPIPRGSPDLTRYGARLRTAALETRNAQNPPNLGEF